MIQTAEEFLRLRTSDERAEYERAAHDEAPLEVWLAVIERYPEMRMWVAQNKTVPVEVLALLSRDSDPGVRTMVAMKRKLPGHLQLVLAGDEDASVRDQIACNGKATRIALEVLAGDAEERIRTRATERLRRGEYT